MDIASLSASLFRLYLESKPCTASSSRRQHQSFQVFTNFQIEQQRPVTTGDNNSSPATVSQFFGISPLSSAAPFSKTMLFFFRICGQLPRCKPTAPSKARPCAHCFADANAIPVVLKDTEFWCSASWDNRAEFKSHVRVHMRMPKRNFMYFAGT